MNADSNQSLTAPDAERRKRWRLVLGGGQADGLDVDLAGDDTALDQCLAALYNSGDPGQRSLKGRGGNEKSAPRVSRWLGDIRKYFPSSTVRIMQKDALDRLGLQRITRVKVFGCERQQV